MIALRRIATALATFALAAGLTVGGTAPARADSGDMAKAIAGIAALAIIADQVDRNRDRAQVRRDQAHSPYSYSPQNDHDDHRNFYRKDDRRNWGHDRRNDRWSHDRRKDRWDDDRRRDWSRSDARRLPRECLIRTRDGRAAYDARCLRRYDR